MEKTPTASKGIVQVVAYWIKPYNPKSHNRLKFEVDTVILFAKTYTPFYIVEWTSFRILIENLDGHITPISRTRLTWKQIQEKVWEIKFTVGTQLAKLNCTCLSFDLLMTQNMENLFSLQDHGMCAWKYEHGHLGMPYLKVGTYGINISILVLKLMWYFTI